MPVSADVILADLQLQHHLNLQRLSSYEYQKVMKVLKQLARELAAKTVLIDPTAPMRVRYRNERTKKLMDEGRLIIGERFTELLKDFQGDMYELAEISSMFAVNSLALAMGLSLGYTLTAEQLREVVSSSYIEGGLLKDWFSRAAENYRLEFQREIQAGMTAGEGIDKMVRRLIGNKRNFPGEKSLYEKQKRGTEALVRTAVMTISNDARMAVFKRNESRIKGYQWSATLDTRTCFVCGELDGKVWDTKGNPRGHNIPYTSPSRHWSCRCVLNPLTVSYEDIEERYGHNKRSSADGYVSSTLYFSDWIATKSPAEQEAYFGKGRYAMYSKGQITFDDLITQRGRPLTLEELRDMVNHRD